MKTPLSRIAAAAALALCAFGAHAQPSAAAAPGSQPPGMHMQDPGRMHQMMQQRQQERHEYRMERLKRILQITPQQEGAWNTFANSMKPPAHKPRDRNEFARLSTPERIDRMKQMRAQRAAEQDRRGDATKTFYAQLTPAQQKAFDELTLKMHGRHRGDEGGGHGGMHGQRG